MGSGSYLTCLRRAGGRSRLGANRPAAGKPRAMPPADQMPIGAAISPTPPYEVTWTSGLRHRRERRCRAYYREDGALILQAAGNLDLADGAMPATEYNSSELLAALREEGLEPAEEWGGVNRFALSQEVDPDISLAGADQESAGLYVEAMAAMARAWTKVRA